MASIHFLLLSALRCSVRSRTDLLLEVAALRQQLGVLQRRVERPRLSRNDRVFCSRSADSGSLVSSSSPQPAPSASNHTDLT